MKKSLIILFVLGSLVANSQSKFPPIDKSPMDICYYPDNYPMLKLQEKTAEPLVARVIYSRPQKAGREIFGDLINYGKVWRLGANEATEIEFFQNVAINKVKIKKGRYSLFAIPNPQSWIIIINKETDTWGSFKYDEKKDVVRIEVPVEKIKEPTENFSMAFSKQKDSIGLLISWDNIQVSMPVTL